MSIIVVVRKGRHAVIAADTAQSDDTLRLTAPYVVNNEKILRAGDSAIGLAGWSATQDIVESVIRSHPGDLEFGDRHQIFESARKLHKLLKKRYFVDPQEDKEQPVESSQLAALIANPAGIFELESYRSVTEYRRFYALGSGKKLALGAMYALYDGKADALSVARAGVAAACEFDDGCALPMTEQVIELRGSPGDAGGVHA